MSEPDSDHEVAADVALRAGDLLLALRAEIGDGRPDELRTEGDRRSHQMILDALAQARPADAVLSEEGEDDPARTKARRLWIVDPLDGTREFGETGRTDWAVHVALWEAGALTAGAVALPAKGELFCTGSPPRPPPQARRRPRLVVSRTRAPAVATTLAAALDAEVHPMGSAGAKAMAVVRGDADVYVHVGAMHEWDVAAPAAVAVAAALHVSRLDGSAIVYNQPEAVVPDLVICRRDLVERVLIAM